MPHVSIQHKLPSMWTQVEWRLSEHRIPKQEVVKLGMRTSKQELEIWNNTEQYTKKPKTKQLCRDQENKRSKEAQA